MPDSNLQLALRKWRTHLLRPQVLATIAGASIITALAGPFGTGDLLGLPARTAYWLVICFAGYSIGALSSLLFDRPLENRTFALRISVVALVSTTLITLVVAGMNFAVFRWMPEGLEWLEFTATLYVITWIVSALVDLTTHQHATDIQAQDTSPMILDRLVIDKRGALVALSVEDHYVRIMTTKGEDMVLMRLSDAIRETAPVDGAQVHRSHWVAWAQVQGAKRKGDGAVLTTTTGTKIPVSRANMFRIRDAGLLPRTRT